MKVGWCNVRNGECKCIGKKSRELRYLLYANSVFVLFSFSFTVSTCAVSEMMVEVPYGNSFVHSFTSLFMVLIVVVLWQ